GRICGRRAGRTMQAYFCSTARRAWLSMRLANAAPYRVRTEVEARATSTRLRRHRCARRPEFLFRLFSVRITGRFAASKKDTVFQGFALSGRQVLVRFPES